MMNARLNKALVALLAVSVAGACDDPPIDPGNPDPARLQVNPGFVVVEAGATRQVQAYLVNELGSPVLGDVSFDACNNVITAEADPDQTDIEPGQNIDITGNTLGESCVNVSGAGFDETIQVRVVPAEISATAVSDTVRAGETGSIDVVLLGADSAEVGPFAEQDAEFASDNEDALFFTDSVGTFDTEEADGVIVTVTFESFGVERTLDIPVTVLPAEPETGYFATEDGTEADAFPAGLVGDTVSLRIFLEDSLGNINNYGADIDDIELTSADEDIATAYAEITEDPDFEGRVVLTAYVVATGQGETDISGTVNTVSGPIDIGTAHVQFLEQVDVASVLPADGEPGDLVTIAGTGMVQTGVETAVFIDGIDVTDFVTVSTPTAITLELAVAGEARDLTVTVDVGGGATQDSASYAFAGEADEPENDDFGTAPTVTLPASITGWMGYGDEDDLFAFVPATSGTLTLSMDWDNEDLDLDTYVFTSDLDAICTGSASGDKPEGSTCEVVAGETYYLYVNDYSSFADGDFQPVMYQVEATM